jgi:thymidine kinase
MAYLAPMVNFAPQEGYVIVVTGPMFCGKTTELIRLLVRAEVAGKKIAIFKPATDDRDADDAIVSRHGFSHSAYPVHASTEIPVLVEEGGYDLVAIDEAQFFDDGIIAIVEQLAADGKQVVVAGLDLTYRREPFGAMAELMVRAEFVEKLQAVCHRCGGPAFFTQRLIDGKPAPFSGETVLVGDLESYEARCRHCYEPGE